MKIANEVYKMIHNEEAICLKKGERYGGMGACVKIEYYDHGESYCDAYFSEGTVQRIFKPDVVTFNEDAVCTKCKKFEDDSDNLLRCEDCEKSFCSNCLTDSLCADCIEKRCQHD